jgi:N-acylneuraminate cytidylyltransferase
MKLCVIPARGGSKRIPGKNTRPFCGKPILLYSIEAASGSGLFDRIVVSTDSEEIAALAREHGAEVPFARPAALSDDHTGTGAVVRHALEWFREQGTEFEWVCCVYATAPFLTADRLREAFEALEGSGKCYAFGATTFAFPVERALRTAPDGGVEPMFPDRIDARSQDLEEALHDAGQFYWGTPQAFLEQQPIFAPHSLAVRLPRSEVQDIDTLEDWERAERMFVAAGRAADSATT